MPSKASDRKDGGDPNQLVGKSAWEKRWEKMPPPRKRRGHYLKKEEYTENKIELLEINSMMAEVTD